MALVTAKEIKQLLQITETLTDKLPSTKDPKGAYSNI